MWDSPKVTRAPFLQKIASLEASQFCLTRPRQPALCHRRHILVLNLFNFWDYELIYKFIVDIENTEFE